MFALKSRARKRKRATDMSLGESFSLLFTQVGYTMIVFWLCGIVLVMIEFYQPMKKISYILGAVTLFATLAIVAVVTESAGACFAFVFLTVSLLMLLHILMLYTHKRRWLAVAAVKKGAKTVAISRLIDKEGIATTDISPNGHVTVEDTNLFVSSETPIARGDKIVIRGVREGRVQVEKIDE